jgi:hypothetical protein
MSLDYLNFQNYQVKDIPLSSNLVDPKIKYFFNQTLKKCHEFKNNHSTFICNIMYLFIFLFILAVILLYKYKGNKNSYEKKIKDRKEKEYILAKLIHINKMNDKEKQNSLGLITELPEINNIVNKNFNYNSFRKQLF